MGYLFLYFRESMDIAQLKSLRNGPLAIHFATVSGTLSRKLPFAGYILLNDM